MRFPSAIDSPRPKPKSAISSRRSWPQRPKPRKSRKTNRGVGAPAAKLINSAPDYDLKLGVYNGFVRAFERLKPSPPIPAQLSLAAMAKAAGVENAEDAVDYFLYRFLRVRPEEADRELMGLIHGAAHRRRDHRLRLARCGAQPA